MEQATKEYRGTMGYFRILPIFISSSHTPAWEYSMKAALGFCGIVVLMQFFGYCRQNSRAFYDNKNDSNHLWESFVFGFIMDLYGIASFL